MKARVNRGTRSCCYGHSKFQKGNYDLCATISCTPNTIANSSIIHFDASGLSAAVSPLLMSSPAVSSSLAHDHALDDDPLCLRNTVVPGGLKSSGGNANSYTTTSCFADYSPYFSSIPLRNNASHPLPLLRSDAIPHIAGLSDVRVNQASNFSPQLLFGGSLSQPSQHVASGTDGSSYQALSSVTSDGKDQRIVNQGDMLGSKETLGYGFKMNGRDFSTTPLASSLSSPLSDRLIGGQGNVSSCSSLPAFSRLVGDEGNLSTSSSLAGMSLPSHTLPKIRTTHDLNQNQSIDDYETGWKDKQDKILRDALMVLREDV